MDIIDGLNSLMMNYVQKPNPTVEETAMRYLLQESISEIKRLRGDFKTRIVEKMNNFIEITGKEPTRIYVDKETELNILCEMADHDPSFHLNGVRPSFTKLFGLDVVWDADKLRVE